MFQFYIFLYLPYGLILFHSICIIQRRNGKFNFSGADTLQDISDMMTDDQDRSEMENLDDLPHDGIVHSFEL